MNTDEIYLNLLQDVLDNGIKKEDRTGTGTISVFGRMIDLDVSQSIPVITTKKVHLKSIIHELLWFISGNTNIKYLNDNGVTIWDEWANKNGDLGPVYGAQWRKWKTGNKKWISNSEYELEMFDQLATVIEEIKNKPSSRRLIVNAWNAPLVWNGDMALPPCHYSYQFIIEDDTISLLWNQRSVDTFLGLPFNIASYGILLYMVASITGYKPKRLIGSLGDVHIYTNHIDQVKEQLTRIPYESPTIWINPEIKNIDDFKYEDIKILNYKAHPKIKADISK
jgi:thymidylate synthase